ncbi:hypothetical protein ABK040_008975 [Willaertia magna]
MQGYSQTWKGENLLNVDDNFGLASIQEKEEIEEEETISFYDIPNEIIEHILIPYFTNKEQLQTLQYINKIFYFYINDNNKWKNDILKFTNFHLENLNKYLNSYKNYCNLKNIIYNELFYLKYLFFKIVNEFPTYLLLPNEDFDREYKDDRKNLIVKEKSNNLFYNNIYCYISNDEHDINLKSNLPIPNLEKDNICKLPIYYIELTILQNDQLQQQNKPQKTNYRTFHEMQEVYFNKQKEKKECVNSLGIIPKNYFVRRQVGWDEHSVGLHFDDCKIFMEEGFSTFNDLSSLKIEIGDTIGFGFYQPKKCIFFTHNGTFYTSPVILDYIIKEEEENVEEKEEEKLEETEENKMMGEEEVKENEEKINMEEENEESIEEEKEKPWFIGVGFWDKCKIQMNFGELPFLFDFSLNIEKLIEEETIERRTLKAEYMADANDNDFIVFDEEGDEIRRPAQQQGRDVGLVGRFINNYYNDLLERLRQLRRRVNDAEQQINDINGRQVEMMITNEDDEELSEEEEEMIENEMFSDDLESNEDLENHVEFSPVRDETDEEM